MLTQLLLIVELALLAAAAYTGRRRIARLLEVREDPGAVPSDVDSHILLFLRSQGGLAYQSDITKALGLPKSTAHKALRRLEEQGLVEIKRQGRVNLVVLREAGGAEAGQE
ncbi:MAG: helix-turn-helix transcriptional regulator [Thermoproteus sp. AZ2]|jgi:uncharacterized membrane protein|uniref:Helix-turn-helix transcriptional regulator n=1 Tax=Thermoproteus sp. AZ2 TaxID=1609232 RepID=A0ACC6UZZ3_9CREN|nr:MAG: TrmB family transcriptional regulator [Thermoproteus sp. AZ2]